MTRVDALRADLRRARAERRGRDDHGRGRGGAAVDRPRPNFFYLQHAMGLASSMGLGHRARRPELQVVVFDGDGSVLMNLGGLTTLARYRPRNLRARRVRQREPALGRRLSHGDVHRQRPRRRSPRPRAFRAPATVRTTRRLHAGVRRGACRRDDLTTHRRQGRGGRAGGLRHRLSLLENRFQFQRYLADSLSDRVGDARCRPCSTQLVAELTAGTLKVVDLTQPLGPETPVIGLPPMFAASPGVTIDVISRYDDKGPAWYWNTLRLGEHTGTHFDAPVHWITGKDLPDNTCDTIPARRFVGPACVIDVTADVASEPRLPADAARIEAWEREHGRIPRRRVGAAAHRLEQADDAERVSQRRRRRPAQSGLRSRRRSRLLARDRDVLGVGVETVGTDAGQAGTFDPPFPESHDHARRGQVRPREPVQPRSAAADRRRRDRRAAQDRERQRQPAARDRHHAGLAEAAVIDPCGGSR